jgi:hypothetical protein
VARRRLRSQTEVAERFRTLAAEVRGALGRLPDAAGDPAVADAAWRAEALGALLWALQLVELPPYDRAFDPETVLGVDPGEGRLRAEDELELERDSARLWHWRARTTTLQQRGEVELPDRYATFDQLIAATAMRGYELGLLPAPMRGDFAAFGKIYRHLAPEQHQLALSIAFERHHALNWVAGLGESWDAVPLDT